MTGALQDGHGRTDVSEARYFTPRAVAFRWYDETGAKSVQPHRPTIQADYNVAAVERIGSFGERMVKMVS